MSTSHRRAWEKELMLAYLEALKSQDVAVPTFDDAWLIYRQQLFNALAWWAGTLGQPPEAPQMQAKESSMTFINCLTTVIDDLDALDAFDS